jgi:Fe-S cluster biogenesis protein NfuA
MTGREDIVAQIDASLDKIRPFLATDGGNIEVVDYSAEGVVTVRLLGNCEKCRMSFSTMRAGVETTIKSAFPQVKNVIAIQ